MISKINEFFSEEIFNENDLEKLQYLKEYKNRKFEKVQIKALFGDRILDIYLFKHCEKNCKYTKAEEYNKFREIYGLNDNLEKLFNLFNFDLSEFYLQEGSDMGYGNKTAFIEALIYEIYKHDKSFMKNVVLKIIEKIDIII